MAIGTEYSVGLNAPAFPRDPLNINMYLEHVLVGQALEPLFTLGDDGNVTRGIAEKWEFSQDQKTLFVSIHPHLVFSNGQALTADDVKFSLERHMSDPASQSHHYLKVINSIDVINSTNLAIQLKYQYIPILLSLTRDQLGILPRGWSFDPNSGEPFRGTGPYRIVRESNQWYLVANENYRKFAEIKIPRWKVDILDVAKNVFPEKPSDLFFLIPKSTNDQIKRKYQQSLSPYKETNSFSFVQYSFWWLNEFDRSFAEIEKMQIRDALEILSKSIVENYGGVLSTGIIPPGIEGSLDERPRDKKSDGKNLIQLRISVPQAVAEMLRAEISSLTELCESKVNIEVIPHDVSRNDSKNLDSPCHMILISYAGGYFDPEGYLSVLPSMVGKDWLSLFGEKAESIRQFAQGEPDKIKRAELYREFSKITQQEFRYIPGWIPTFSDFRNPKLSKRPTAFKFSYKLIDYDENLRNEEK